VNTTQILVVTLATPAVSVLLFLLRRLEDGLPGAGRDGEPAAPARPQAALPGIPDPADRPGRAGGQ
jgi:hypothetical protein